MRGRIMLSPSIRYDTARSYVITQLERLERKPPDTRVLQQAFQVADLALMAVEHALETRAEDLEDVGRRAYLTAIILAKTIDCMPMRDSRLVEFRRTATNMLMVLERLARPEDRELRARALHEIPQHN